MNVTVQRVEEGTTLECIRSNSSCSDDHESRGTNVKQMIHCHNSEERSLPLKDFYPYIRCGLCNGFLIDATTITECLHTFCKSCIVKHFLFCNRCPNCSIVVHQTQPLYHIRPDRQLQDMVFKMVPYLEEDERSRICEFYSLRGLKVPKPAITNSQPVKKSPRQKPRQEKLSQSVCTIPSDLDMSLMLVFVGAEDGVGNFKPLKRKYVLVSGEATIRHVELFIKRKMELGQNCKVDVVCGDHHPPQCQSLREVCKALGERALQDGMLVLHFGLVLPN